MLRHSGLAESLEGKISAEITVSPEIVPYRIYRVLKVLKEGEITSSWAPQGAGL